MAPCLLTGFRDMLMQEPILVVDRLSVAFHTRRETLLAIEDVCLSIEPGEIFAVVGESGAGKSVTGTAVMGLLEPTAEIKRGRIILDGREIQNLSPHEWAQVRGRQIGAIFQDPMSSLDPIMRIGDQLVETIRCHSDLGREEAQQKAEALLGEVGISEPARRLRQYPHEFSGGMRQRVVIALALCGSPRLLIADEPTTALDAWTQVQIIALLRRLCRERGMAVMLITHDMGVVSAVADRTAVMYAGRVVECGVTKEIIESPRHPYTRGLMAAVPKIGMRTERLAQIDGAMLAPSARGDFCGFHPRCSFAFAACSAKAPPIVTAGERSVACWLETDGGDRDAA
jgi:peptide/nickel transport system ATP-binding protein